MQSPIAMRSFPATSRGEYTVPATWDMAFVASTTRTRLSDRAGELKKRP